MSTTASPTTDTVAVAAAGVVKYFRTGRRTITALEGITFTLSTGGIAGLIGPDGAGKTTLLRLIAGLLASDRGTISVFDRDPVTRPQAVHATLGYMPQRFGLYEDLTVRENLDLYADLHGVQAEERPLRFRELSGGMKQKLGLACTLVAKPRLLLLDEPTVGVDPVSRRELWSIIERMVAEGTTVLLSTAYLDEAERCSEVFILHGGRLLWNGAPDAEREALTGRCYQVRVADRSLRSLQTRLAAQPDIIDAVIQGDAVRVLTTRPIPPALADLSAESPGLTVVPAPPRFEDGFIARLKPLVEPALPLQIFAPSPGPAVRSKPSADEPVAVFPSRSIEAMEVVIEVRNVERRFGGFTAVQRLSFEVRRGEVFGLLGANGAGKTTTFRMLCGLLPPSQGSLRVLGVDLRRAAAEARARIGYMSQKFSLYGVLSVRQNLEFFASAYRLRGERRRARLDFALEHFQLTAHADQPSADLPLGHKQRLALACALLHEPEILFLDEPTSGVDPLMRRGFWSAINTLAENGVTVLVTTHFLEEAEYCDRLVILAAGSLLASGRPSEIRALARCPELPNPTLEEAFIQLLKIPPLAASE